MAKATPTSISRKTYDVRVGFNYTPVEGEPEVRHEAGELAVKLPLNTARHLISEGVVEQSGDA